MMGIIVNIERMYFGWSQVEAISMDFWDIARTDLWADVEDSLIMAQGDFYSYSLITILAPISIKICPYHDSTQ